MKWLYLGAFYVCCGLVGMFSFLIMAGLLALLGYEVTPTVAIVCTIIILIPSLMALTWVFDRLPINERNPNEQA